MLLWLLMKRRFLENLVSYSVDEFDLTDLVLTIQFFFDSTPRIRFDFTSKINK